VEIACFAHDFDIFRAGFLAVAVRYILCAILTRVTKSPTEYPKDIASMTFYKAGLLQSRERRMRRRGSTGLGLRSVLADFNSNLWRAQRAWLALLVAFLSAW
jgi:hypothetical protein